MLPPSARDWSNLAEAPLYPRTFGLPGALPSGSGSVPPSLPTSVFRACHTAHAPLVLLDDGGKFFELPGGKSASPESCLPKELK